MQWLKKVVDDITSSQPEGEIVVSSGVSPSGKYHLGTLREVLTAEVIARELRQRGRSCRHIHVVDDLDALRKVPAGIPEEFNKQLGKPLYLVPSPDGGGKSYAEYFLSDLFQASKQLKLEMEVMLSHEKYQAGFFVPAIELALQKIEVIRQVLETVSGHKLGDEWSPIQINEDGYLKKRSFISIDTAAKTVAYADKDGAEQVISYSRGDVKLDWRIDWPARWWLLSVGVEPFGRDHATKGGSYDTGAALMDSVFKAKPPLPVPYAFINRTGENKKMSKSAGDTVNLSTLLQVLPPEVVWYFIIRHSPEKQLFFDEGEGLVRLIDEFAELVAKPGKTPEEEQLLALCTHEIELTVSSVPFSHLVASYQAALKDPAKTVEIIARTEHGVHMDAELVKKELAFIDQWLEKWAPEEIKFNIEESITPSSEQLGLSDAQKIYLSNLADRIEKAPQDADGEWFHKTIYEFKDSSGLDNKELFSTIYRVLINKDYGPRAGWFLLTLYDLRGNDWLVKRLKLEG